MQITAAPLQSAFLGRWFIAMTIASLFHVHAPLFAAVEIATLGATYTQDFDSLASSGTSSALPLGWELFEFGVTGNDMYAAGTGSSNVGDVYSFGSSGAADRAFGMLRRSGFVPTVGVAFLNNTGAAITGLDVGYAGEQWRLGAVRDLVDGVRIPDRLDFQYSFDAVSVTTGTWTDVDPLDFLAPQTTGTVGSRDGNAGANRAVIAGAISSIVVPSGQTFWLRWNDHNVALDDDGLAIDDFSLIARGAAPPDPGITHAPEAAALWVWSVLGGVALGGGWAARLGASAPL